MQAFFTEIFYSAPVVCVSDSRQIMRGHMFDIQEELKKLPPNPGVYIMHDKYDAIIYVGKAINLNRRVHSYFRASTKKTVKIQRMVSQIDHFEYIVTD